MPPRIQPYTDQEQIRVVRDPDFNLPNVVDAGGKISQVGDALMRATEPTLRDRAERQAIEDAGAATIVKTPDGGYERQNLTQGGGLVYARAYSQALDTRQINLMSEDYTTQLSLVAEQWINDPEKRDPEAFNSFASGLAQGMLDAAPASIKAELDTRFTRELSQSVRGFAVSASRIQRQQTVNDLKTSLDNIGTDIGRIAQTTADPTDREKSINARIAEGVEIIGRLHDLGEIADQSPYLERLSIESRPELDYVQSMQSMLGLGGNIGRLPDEALQRLVYWGTYHTDDQGGDGMVGGMSFDAFNHLFPSQHGQQMAAQLANEVLNRRIQAANAAALQASVKAADTVDVPDLEANHDNINAHPASGMSRGQFAVVQSEYDSHGAIAFQLRDPDRRIATLGFLAQTGEAPKGTVDALRSLALSGSPQDQEAAFDFIWNARNVSTGNTWSGVNFFNSLPDDLKAMAHFDATMRAAGYDTTTRLREMIESRSGKNASMGDIVSLFGREQDYAAHRNAAIAKAFGVEPDEMGTALPQLARQFDKLVTINGNLYTDKEQILSATAQVLTNGWAVTNLFVGGFGDKRIVAEGIPAWAMDKMVADTGLRAGNLASASFANGRIRLQPLEDSTGKRLGHYELQFFNDRGERVPGKTAIVSMDTVVAKWRAAKAQLASKEDARTASLIPPEPYHVGRSPDGRVRFVPNPAFAEWQKRHEKAAAHLDELGTDYRRNLNRLRPNPGAPTIVGQ